MTTTTPAPVRRGSRRLVGLSAALAGVAAAATAVVLATGLVGGPAYAVTKDADGGVSVEVRAFTDPEGLESELAAAGVKAVVDYLPQGQTCKQPRGAHGGGSGPFQAGIGVGPGGSGIAFKIGKGQVPDGSTLVLTVSKSKDGDDRPPFATTLELVQGEVSACEPTSMPVPPASDGGTSQQDSGPSNDSGTEEGPGLTSKEG
ncbi:hypothetical protein AB0I81_16750 [Nonomuraea sp. NPDC050404]|uniref:hypothetical protein n=1 Tax=Nonomuraea sp. NPDC050404 TaxID=3155783 RepID=UPI003411858C